MKSSRNVIKSLKILKRINNYGVRRALVQLEKEINIYLKCNKEKKYLKKRIKSQLSKKDKVQIGGGSHYLDGFINIDIAGPADIIYDVRKNIPLPSSSVQSVFSEHFLEHIDFPHSVSVFFKETHRILEIGGSLIIGVPDSGMAIKAYTESDTPFLNKLKKEWYKKRKIYKNINCALDVVTLVIKDEDADLKYNPHYWGYDKKGLIKLYKKFGFRKIKEWRFDKKIANVKREFGSIYMEGFK